MEKIMGLDGSFFSRKWARGIRQYSIFCHSERSERICINHSKLIAYADSFAALRMTKNFLYWGFVTSCSGGFNRRMLRKQRFFTHSAVKTATVRGCKTTLYFTPILDIFFKKNEGVISFVQ
jgi:hypothetical protein